MVIGIVANISETKSMVLGCTTLLMATATRAHGMKEGDRVLEHTHSEMVRGGLVSGTVAFWRTASSHQTLLSSEFLRYASWTYMDFQPVYNAPISLKLNYFDWFRLQGRQQRMLPFFRWWRSKLNRLFQLQIKQSQLPELPQSEQSRTRRTGNAVIYTCKFTPLNCTFFR